MRPVHPAALFVGVLACGGGGASASFTALMTEPGAVGATDPGSTGPQSGGEGPGDGPSSTSNASSEGSGTTDDPVLWDMGVPDIGSRVQGCRGKIDFMFVISADGTMLHHQQQLLDSFPGFIDTLEAQLPYFDLHVMVADPDNLWQMDDCGLCTDSCDAGGAPPTCGAIITDCDKEMGAGVTYPVGKNATNRRCELTGDRRYIVSGEDDLAEDLACVAQVGTHGSARVAEAMVTALADPEGCNPGFLRDDALLIVTLVQDTFDEESYGVPQSWLKALHDAKSGDDDAFAVLVLTTDVDIDARQLCHPGTFIPYLNPLRVLTDLAKHGYIASICLPTYDEFFAESVAKIVTLCESYTPPAG